MKISVSMITFQGASYLKAQMDSILGQSHPVDEIIVCDDSSADGTRALLTEYASKYPQITLQFNQKNLGTVANMQQCLRLTSGDIIFLADQDDVWEENKVENTIALFEANPDKSAIFSNASIINESGDLLPELHLWDIIGYPYPKVNLPQFIGCIDNVVTGAGFAMKRDAALLDLDIPQIPGMLHDGWLGLYFASQDRLMANPEKNFRYRTHANQQVGGKIEERNELLSFNLALYAGEPRMKDFKTWRDAMNRLYTHLTLPYTQSNKIMTQISSYATYGKTNFPILSHLFLLRKAIR